MSRGNAATVQLPAGTMGENPRVPAASFMTGPTIVYIDQGIQDLPHTRQICAQLPSVPTETIADVRWLQHPQNFIEGKQRWLLTKAPRRWMQPLTPVRDGILQFAADLVVNTPYDCSYSPLRISQRKRPLIQIFTNVEVAIADLAQRFAKSPRQAFRIRLGHHSDALAIDDVTLFSHTLVPFFALMPNATLELRTRTNNIGHLLSLAHQGRTVITFAVNPRTLILGEERGTASLLERLIAARRCLNAGYRIAFAIDPIIQCHGWERLYEELLDELFTHIPPEQVDGIDLACLHYPRGLPERALRDFPGSHIFYGELVPMKGGYRYFRPIRESIYQWFAVTLHKRQVRTEPLQASA